MKLELSAAENALRHYGYQEAIDHLQSGVTTLLTLPDTPERAQQERSEQARLEPTASGCLIQAGHVTHQLPAEAVPVPCREAPCAARKVAVRWAQRHVVTRYPQRRAAGVQGNDQYGKATSDPVSTQCLHCRPPLARHDLG